MSPDYESGGDNADSVREMYRDEQDDAYAAHCKKFRDAGLTADSLAAARRDDYGSGPNSVDPADRQELKRAAVYRIELTTDQMFAIKLALEDSARWYAKHGGEELAHRISEARAVLAHLDQQIPESSADSKE